MKYGLLLLIAIILLWQWRHARGGTSNPSQRKKPAPPEALSMVRCAQCGLHLPEQESIQGQKGVYCSVAHRQAQEP
jgi:uncharacterized protein